MTGTLYTLGYAAKDAEAHLVQLMADPSMLIVDIRFNPVSRWLPAWNKTHLSERWNEWDVENVLVPVTRYTWFKSLGNIDYKRQGEIRLYQPEKGIPAVVTLLTESKRDVVLLCACKDYEMCHRRVVYDLVMAALLEKERKNG